MDLCQTVIRMPGPPIRERLRSNLAPSGAEKVAIMEALDAAQARLVALRMERAPSAEISSEEITLSAFLTEYSSLLSTVRRLPDDVLGIIFLDPDIYHVLDTGDLGLAAGTDPLYLTAVCSHWRAVILDMPLWWSSIATSITAGQGCLSRLELFLQRSRDAPLSVYLGIESRGLRDVNRDIVQAISQEARRWKFLSIPSGSDLDFVAGAGPFPLLETIEFKTSRHDTAQRIADAPKLHAISLPYITGSDEIPDVPASQILELSAELRSRDLCQPLLSTFPNTNHLMIRMMVGTTWRAVPGPPPHHSVRTLVLLGRAFSILDVFDVLNLPNLERLELFDCDT
ncbi:hypothetical protein C8R46DRAFT_368385 [Mycena filopes]|nr:hypothetical protein C8R46DRAFT_368385 [Mycena filopes]